MYVSVKRLWCRKCLIRFAAVRITHLEPISWLSSNNMKYPITQKWPSLRWQWAVTNFFHTLSHGEACRVIIGKCNVSRRPSTRAMTIYTYTFAHSSTAAGSRQMHDSTGESDLRSQRDYLFSRSRRRYFPDTRLIPGLAVRHLIGQFEPWLRSNMGQRAVEHCRPREHTYLSADAGSRGHHIAMISVLAVIHRGRSAKGDASRWSVSKYNGQTVWPEGWGTGERSGFAGRN